MTITINFNNVPLNGVFFDPNSGEYWKRINENQAMIISGGDYLEGNIDSFDIDDVVIAK